MNRHIVRYSTLGSIAVAAVAGTVYLLSQSDTQADDQAAGSRASSHSASSSKTSGRSQGPDPLFAEPVSVWKRDERPAVNEPFQDRTSPVVQTGFGDAAPRRLTPDPNAVPLQSVQQQEFEDYSAPRERLAAGSQAVPDDAAQPASESPKDPFGLQNSLRVNPAREAAMKKLPSGRRPPGGTLPAGDSESADEPPVSSTYRNPPSGENETDLSAVEPAPLQGNPFSQAGNVETPRRSSAFEVNRADGRQPADLPQAQLDDRESVSPAGDRYSPVGPIDDPASRLNAAPTVSGGNGFTNERHHALGDESTAAGSRAIRGAVAGAIGSGRPGSRQVEGKQAPQVTIEKVAPPEIQVGKPAKFELHVRNTGAVVAQNVRVRDLVPEGTEFVAANPPATPGAQGELDWSLGTLKPGDETTIEVEVTPTTEGEVGSVAVVVFETEAGARSRVTRPDLTLQITAAKEVMIGQEVLLSIKIANPGSGPATDVVLKEHVPPGLKHAAGPELEFEVGTLKPGETRELELALTAAQAGRVVNQIAARGEGNLQVEAQCELEVIAPALEVQMDGPSRRYLERQATYTVSVSNPGTAPAKDIELVTRLPRGLKFVKANNSGHYDPGTHSVMWSLEELPPAESGTVMLTAIPIEPGEQRLRAEGRAQQNLTDEQEQVTLVEGVAALLFQVMDVADPIEVKGETQYEIRVTNQGSKSADNVRLMALVPPELKFVSAEGPTRHAVEGQKVFFEPLARLAPKADTSYRIAVQGLRPGDLRMRVQLTTDDMQQPVIKEESTRVYADE